ncbi:MAG: Gfo/Idh/MocA family protein [Solirubrobacterales bacterium]
MDELRAALIGYGLAGSVFHGPLITSTPGLTVGTVVTSDPQRRERALAECPGAQVVPKPDEVFDRASDHDFVVVATPNDTHAPLARRAVDAGLPVVVDKPLAPTAAEARAVVEHSDSTGVPLTVFLNRRWDSDHLTAKRLLGEGKLGEIVRYESRFERWRPRLSDEGPWREQIPPEAGGGILLDIGPHLVDQALALFGPVQRVYAEIDARRGGPADDDAFLALEHASGTHSHLWASLLAAAPGPRLRVLGDRAAYVVTEIDGQEEALREGARPQAGQRWGEAAETSWGRLTGESGDLAVPSEPGSWPSFYAGFERALRDGAPPPVDPLDAVAGLEVLDAARRGAVAGEAIELR